MVTTWSQMRVGMLAMALAGTGLVALPSVAHAQDQDARLRKIESEIRALQRKVFPGGDGRFFTPEVIATETAPQAGVGTPSTSALTDVLGRLDAMEAQLRRLTAQTEENTNAVSLLSSRLDTLEAERDARIAAQQPVVPSSTPTSSGGGPAGNAAGPLEPVASEPAPPSPQRLAAVQEITKPDSGDAADDEYVYGFRLWDAGFYPEAQQQLRLFVEKYPSHWRISYGRNLLGRAYLDDGKPREAAPWFLKNYQSDMEGVRAPDSLLYLAESMIAIDDTNRACIALAEFGENYTALASGRLQAQYEKNRSKVNCSTS